MNSISPTTIQAEKQWDLFHVAILLGAALLRFVNLGFLDLQAWDEALYSMRAQAALYPGLWIDQTPLAIDGLYSSLHPPFYVWGTALVYQLLGVSEFSSRFVSALSAGVTIFVIYLIGKELRSKQTGIIAALLYSFTPFTCFYSRQGQFDALLVLFLTLSVFAIVKSMQRPDRLHVLMAGVFVGCALMTKLFVAFGIPVAYAFWVLTVKPANKGEHWIRIALVALLAFAVAAPWHLYMIITHGDGNPLFFLESSAIVQRTLFGVEGNVQPLEVFYYPNQLIVLFPFGIAAFLYGAWRSYRTRDPLWIFLALWFLSFFIVFSVMRTKLAVYLLPMLVPASLLAGTVFEDISKGTIEGKTPRLLIVLTICSVIWSSSQVWRDSVKGLISSLLSFLWPDQSNLIGTAFLLGAVTIGCGISLIILSGKRALFARYFPHVALLFLFTLSMAAIVVFDRHQYVDGAASFAEFVDRSNVKQIVVAGYERNPQLTYYLKGADIGWRDDLHVRRIVPPNDTALYRPWLQMEMIGEPASTLLLIEKDKFIRYHTIDPNVFLTDGYVRVFESRRYAAFVAGQIDFLASAFPPVRN